MSIQDRVQQALHRTKEDIIHEDVLDTIPILENGELLLDIQSVTNAYIQMRQQRKEYAGENKLYARETVVRMLQLAERLLPEGYGLVVFDAFRPLKYQQMRFNKVFEDIRAKNPSWNDEEVRNEAFIYVFPPSEDPLKPPAHSTGGAVDLTLHDTLGALIDVGCGYGEFDNPAMYTASTEITREQRKNRKHLLEVMLRAGFVNYPGEWWHFSYGDREWAAYENKCSAVYARAEESMIKK